MIAFLKVIIALSQASVFDILVNVLLYTFISLLWTLVNMTALLEQFVYTSKCDCFIRAVCVH